MKEYVGLVVMLCVCADHLGWYLAYNVRHELNR